MLFYLCIGRNREKGSVIMAALEKWKGKSGRQIAMQVSVISIAVNLLLSVFKLIAGIFGRSSAMISDAVHSASDVFSTLIVMVGVTVSNKASDENHQYGHERLECVASLILAAILALTGLGIGIKGVEQIINGGYDTLKVPGGIALAAAVISIVVKEWMFWFTRGAARKIDSGSLMADAWHHRTDALSSIGSFIGILGARLGFPIMDPLASVVICIFIVKAAFDIFRDSVEKMVDTSCEEEVIEKMRKVILDQEGVLKIDVLKTRMFGSKIYVDIEIGADAAQTLREAHDIAESVHDAIEEEFGAVKHCMVHVNPV